MIRLQFPVEEEYAACKLGGFLRRQQMSVSLVRSLKHQPQGMLVNGQPARTNWLLKPGDIVECTLPPDEMVLPPEPIPLKIVYEDAHSMVVNKQAGLVVHPTRSHPDGTMANAFVQLMNKRGWCRAFRPVGRLDGDTSGLVLLAMNAYAAPVLRTGLVKSYLALVWGCPGKEGEIDAPLGPAEDSVIRQCVRPDGKPSLTRYETIAKGKKASLLRVWPQTGRTHQIRAHFAHIGHPLVGDSLYGGHSALLMFRHALHCETIHFVPPPALVISGGNAALQSSPEISLQCSVPADMARAALLLTGYSV